MTHAERERLFLGLFRENKSGILLRGDRPRFRRQCAVLAWHLAGTVAAWRLGLWLREKRDRAERRPLLAQLTAMERAFKEGPA